jgi:hypothetical protein
VVVSAPPGGGAPPPGGGARGGAGGGGAGGAGGGGGGGGRIRAPLLPSQGRGDWGKGGGGIGGRGAASRVSLSGGSSERPCGNTTLLFTRFSCWEMALTLKIISEWREKTKII